MTPEEITEWNILISVFMGENIDDYGYKMFGPDDYGLDWNKLMMVVEKIEKDNDYYFEIQRDWINVYRFNDRSGLIVKAGTFIHGRDKLYTVWLTVVELIKWHNKNK